MYLIAATWPLIVDDLCIMGKCSRRKTPTLIRPTGTCAYRPMSGYRRGGEMRPFLPFLRISLLSGSLAASHQPVRRRRNQYPQPVYYRFWRRAGLVPGEIGYSSLRISSRLNRHYGAGNLLDQGRLRLCRWRPSEGETRNV